MKISKVLLFVTLIVLVFAVTSASASSFTFETMVNIQNLNGSEASVRLDFYNMNGTVAGTVNDTIGANNDKLYFPLGVGDGFNGSMVIKSGNNIRAVANLYGTGTGSGAASYTGMQSGDTDVLLPLLMKANGGFDTWFHVQNTSDTDATVDITYSDGTNVLGTIIPAGSAALFDQSLETHSLQAFSGVISSTQPVVATVIEEETGGNVIYAYNGFGKNSTDLGPDMVAPLINENNNGYISSVQIQNAGDVQTTVTLTYTPEEGAGTPNCVETHVLDPGEMEVYAFWPFAGYDPSIEYAGSSSDCDELYSGQAKFVGSATVTTNSATQNLVAIPQQLLLDGGYVNGEAYSAYNPINATNEFVMPLVLEHYGAEDYVTSINFMRVGGTTGFTVTCNFSDNAYTYTSPSLDTDGDQAVEILYEKLDPTHGGSGGYVGSAVCTASEADAQIVAVVNQLGLVGSGDMLLVYEGLSSD